jgi:ankyrin repeat protein
MFLAFLSLFTFSYAMEPEWSEYFCSVNPLCSDDDFKKGWDPFSEERDATFSFGDKCLAAFACKGDLPGIRDQLSRGIFIDTRGADNKTPLMNALAFGQVSAVKFLLEKGANPRVRDDFDNSMFALLLKSPLYKSDRAKVYVLAELLLKKSADHFKKERKKLITLAQGYSPILDLLEYYCSDK